jgi:phosphatidylglycerol---prolipoprotein diacylglyceryl transferase
LKPVLLAFHLPVVGEVVFPAYFTLLTIGFGLAMILTVREGKKLGMDRERVLDTNLWMVVWGIIGARVLHLIADGHFHDYVNLCVDSKLVPAIDAKVLYCNTAAQCGYDYLCDTITHKCYPPKDCFAAIKVWRGGLAYYGGFIFATAFAWYYVRKHKLGWWRTADLASPGIMLGLFFGRIGCWLNGCCYGQVTHSAFGVKFPAGGSVWRAQYDAHLIQIRDDALPVHATQLYESLACFLIFAILYYVVRPRRRAFGEVFAWMLMLYAIGRSVCEIWRDDDRGVFFGGYLSTSQLISIPLFLGGAGLLAYLLRGRNKRAA